MFATGNTRRVRLMIGAAAGALALMTGTAYAQSGPISIKAQPLTSALYEFGSKSTRQVMFTPDVTASKMTAGVSDAPDELAALDQLLKGTGLTYRPQGDVLVVMPEEGGSGPQSASAAGDGAEVEALIVTAQKKEEDIQDVPIAISAFTETALQEQKIEGGFDLLKAIPNVTFSKNNFTSYNFSIRGIGTKAVSATTDPAVAVAFNSNAMIVNRLFEQEYFDVERVEVLRGPQGTLYGRNATSGVINVISAKPNLREFSGWLKGEVGNYNAKRVSAMVNVPLVDGKVAMRLAGALTNRDGYGHNAVTGEDVDGRDLWSTRMTLGFEPSESLRGNLIWERFEEDDNRARTSKQLCHTDLGPQSLPHAPNITPQGRGMLSQGCKPGSLYDEGAFQAPFGFSLPYIIALQVDTGRYIEPFVDPYSGLTQSTDLREISSLFDPIYRAQADVVELNFEYDLTSSLTLVSQTLYNKDEIYSTQDYNRFNTRPVFSTAPNACPLYPSFSVFGCPGGYYTDPQLGTANTIVVQDVSQGGAEQFSQEFRLQSGFAGPVNFSVGANYVRFQTNIDYYVISNAFSLIPSANQINAFIDTNPLNSISGDGHNYFRSQNPYLLKSASAFGELYWNVAGNLKFTAGLRYTDDRKKFELWPTELLNAKAADGGSRYNQEGEIEQHWGELTGRLGVDWKPDLSFTDDTMLYATYSRGYKAGGANPPNMACVGIQIGGCKALPPNAIHPATFDPEFVDAFEVGAKNVLMGGALIFNATGFYYDYKDYQVSQIIDRLALNENYDATVWGLEFETIFSVTPDLRINANLGYLDTRIKNGESSIDVMNRTFGHEDEWVVLKNWVQFPSNCIIPREIAGQIIEFTRANGPEFTSQPAFYDRAGLLAPFDSPCVGMYTPGERIYSSLFGNLFYDFTGIAYDPFDQALYPETNNGQGFATPLGGNELPNAPHWTTNVGVQYSFDLLEGWRTTARADAYWQSQSWARVYNLDPYDKLHGWYNANLSVWFENDEGLKIELYAKNVLDDDPITDAFLNSDDSGLTTNVFVLDPRLIGLSIRKEF